MSTVFAITCRGTIPACGGLLAVLSLQAAARAEAVGFLPGPLWLAAFMIAVGSVAWVLELR